MADRRRQDKNKGEKKGKNLSGRFSQKKGPEKGTEKRSDNREKKEGDKKWRPAPKFRNKSYSKKRTDDGTLRLNKFIANSGICSRREADEFIKSGLVEVNGKTITEMGYRVQPTDEIKYAGERIAREKPVYVLLNKPKDFALSGVETPTRRTAYGLLKGIGTNRIGPVGRMNRDTSGLVIFTNDGEMAKRLSLSKSSTQKIYHIHTDKPVKAEHIKAMNEGFEIDGKEIKVTEASYVGDGKDRKQLGLEIRGGKNQLVRDVVGHFGYKILRLDRVVYAGLTKKDLPRGKWRHITPAELTTLKMLK